jgi:hypothetical protein
MDTYVKWTDEEWAALAKRAAALKTAKPDMSWTQIVPVCQDDIAPERRRFTINKLSGLKPMFDILGLDEHGNVKPPPPPPPPPTPEPEAPKQEAAASTATPPFNPTSMASVPTEVLVAEVFARGAALKEQIDGLTGTKAQIMELLEANKVKLDSFLKRVDEVENYVLQCMEGMDRINVTYENMLKASEEITEEMRRAGLFGPDSKVKLQPFNPSDPTQTKTLPNNEPSPRIMPTRILIVGPLEKELPRIKERLPRSLNVDLLHGENADHIKLPTNIHYALVSGHNDCSRRWATVRAHYGDKAHRMANGSIGTFVHAIEELCVRRG